MKIAAAGVALSLTGLILAIVVPHPVFVVPVIGGLLTIIVGGIVHWRQRRR